MSWRRRSSNGNGQAVVQSKPEPDSAAIYFQLQAIAQDMRTLSAVIQDVRHEQTLYHSAAEKVGYGRHGEVTQALEEYRNQVVDYQQAVERRLPAA